MSLDDRIVAAVGDNKATTVAALARECATTDQVIKMRLGKLVKDGRLARNGDEIQLGDDPLADEPEPRRRTPRKATAEPEPEAEILFAADEDGDLQLSRRDGEGEILCVPSAEIARLVAFVGRNFRDALRG